MRSAQFMSVRRASKSGTYLVEPAVLRVLAAELEETSPRTGFRLVVVLHDVTAYDQAFLWADHSPDFKRGLADRRYRRKPSIEIDRGVPS